VWCEAEAKQKLTGKDRTGLAPSGALAIWTSPPGPSELQAVLDIVLPGKVYLFAVDPGMDDPGAFLKRLTGLVKHALKAKDGRSTLAGLATATSQREPVVRLGLKWLQARGYIRIVSEETGEVILDYGGDEPEEALSWVTDQLHAILGETAAYRAYFARAEKDALLHNPAD
jgi:single-stranded-DNA-specific exonuclease